MIREMIQEYLVGLGVQIDKPGFNQMNQTLQTTEQMVAKVTGSWTANFLRASTIIGTAIAGVTAAGMGMIRSAARQEIEMEKLSRSMMMTKDDVLTLKKATDALGESLNDILLSPELTRQFRQLTAEGRSMQVGGDFKETMQYVREILFEFTRLKQEASYALTWVGYYLTKYMARPLAKMRENLKEFNDSFVSNMSTWTEKIAKWISLVINVGLHFIQFLTDVGKALWKVWDSFPKGVKIAIAAITLLGLVIQASPVGRMMMLVSGLLLLIDDYYAHMEGRKSLFGEYWDQLNDILDMASDSFESLSEWLSEATTRLIDWFDELGKNETLLRFLDAITELWNAIKEMAVELWNFTTTGLKQFFNELSKDGPLIDFSGAIQVLINLLIAMVKWLSTCIKRVSNLLKVMSNNRIVRMFFEGAAIAVKNFTNFVVEAVKKVGMLGQALVELLNGNYVKAARLAKEAIFGAIDSRDTSHGGGGGSFGGGKTSAGFNGDPSEVAVEAWEAAKRIGAEYNINPALIYGQWYHETAGFTSDLMEDNNLGGMTQTTPIEGMEQPDGTLWYKRYASREDYYADWARTWGPYVAGSQDSAEYAQRLQDEGYYGAPYEEYKSGVENGMENLPSTASSGGGILVAARPDPYITNGMTNGFMSTGYNGGTYSSSSNAIYNLNLGGITINGDVDNPRTLGETLANKVLSKLGGRAETLMVNRTITGTPIMT